MKRKIILDKPSTDSSLEYILRYLKYEHNKTHILNAYHLLASLDPDRNGTVADFGCGGLETLMIFSQMGFKNIIAADYDEDLMKEAAGLFKGIKTYHADFNDPLPLEDESCDVATSFEAVEHVVSAEFFMSELHRVIKKGGHLIITTPNHAFYMSRWRAVRGERLGKEGVHYRFFTKDHFEEIIQKAGFEITGRNSIGHYPFVNMEPWRSILRRKRVHHYVPESMESLFAINFVWLCRKR